MIIDSLVHVTPDGKWFNTGHDASAERLLKEMDNAGVDKSVVVALDGHIENEFVHNICTDHSDRLLAGASFNPCRFESNEQILEALDDVFAHQSFKVIKLHPRLNGYDPLDPRVFRLEALTRLKTKVPVWLDTVFRSNACLLRKSPVDAIQELAYRFPDIHFVLLHGAGVHLLQLAEMVGQFQNLTIDLSLTMLYYEHSSIETDIDFILKKRDRCTILGSDFPEYSPLMYMDKFSIKARRLGLDDSSKSAMLGGNLKRIIGI